MWFNFYLLVQLVRFARMYHWGINKYSNSNTDCIYADIIVQYHSNQIRG